jgi:dTDP-D-glucose 4,6-dehydratase
MDATKIQRTLGWRPTIDFNAGVESTVRWYLDNIKVIDWACASRFDGPQPGERPTESSQPSRLIAEPGF